MKKQSKPKGNAAKKFSEVLTQDIKHVKDLESFNTKLPNTSLRNSERNKIIQADNEIEDDLSDKVRAYLLSQGKSISQYTALQENNNHNHNDNDDPLFIDFRDKFNVNSSFIVSPIDSTPRERLRKENCEKAQMAIDSINKYASSINQSNDDSLFTPDRIRPNVPSQKAVYSNNNISSIQYIASGESKMSIGDVDFKFNTDDNNLVAMKMKEIDKKANNINNNRGIFPFSSSEKSLKSLIGIPKSHNAMTTPQEKISTSLLESKRNSSVKSRKTKDVVLNDSSYQYNSNSRGRSKSKQKNSKNTDYNNGISPPKRPSSINNIKPIDGNRIGLRIKYFEPVLKTLKNAKGQVSRSSANSNHEPRQSLTKESGYNCCSNNINQNNLKILEPQYLNEDIKHANNNILMGKLEKGNENSKNAKKSERSSSRKAKSKLAEKENASDLNLKQSMNYMKQNGMNNQRNFEKIAEIIQQSSGSSIGYSSKANPNNRIPCKHLSFEGLDVSDDPIIEQDCEQDTFITPRELTSNNDNEHQSKNKFDLQSQANQKTESIAQTPYFDLEKLPNIQNNSKLIQDTCISNINEFLGYSSNKKLINNANSHKNKQFEMNFQEEKKICSNKTMLINQQDVGNNEPRGNPVLSLSYDYENTRPIPSNEENKPEQLNPTEKKPSNTTEAIYKNPQYMIKQDNKQIKNITSNSNSNGNNNSKPLSYTLEHIDGLNVIENENNTREEKEILKNTEKTLKKLEEIKNINDSQGLANCIQALNEACKKISIKSFLILRTISIPSLFTSLVCEGLTTLFTGFSEVSEDFEIKLDEPISWQNIQMLFSMPIRYINLITKFKSLCDDNKIPSLNITRLSTLMNDIEKQKDYALHEEKGITLDHTLLIHQFLKAALNYCRFVGLDMNYQPQVNRNLRDIQENQLEKVSSNENKRLNKEDITGEDDEEPMQLTIQPNCVYEDGTNRLLEPKNKCYESSTDIYLLKSIEEQYFSKSMEDSNPKKSKNSNFSSLEAKLNSQTAMLSDITKTKNDLMNQIQKLRKNLNTSQRERENSYDNKIKKSKSPSIKEKNQHKNSNKNINSSPENLKSVFHNERITQLSAKKPKVSEILRKPDPESLADCLHRESIEEDIEKDLLEIKDYKEKISRMLVENERRHKSIARALEKAQETKEREYEIDENKRQKNHFINQKIIERLTKKDLNEDRIQSVKIRRENEQNQEKEYFENVHSHTTLVHNMKSQEEKEKNLRKKIESRGDPMKYIIDREYKKYQASLERASQMNEIRAQKRQNLEFNKSQINKVKKQWENNYNIIHKLVNEHK